MNEKAPTLAGRVGIYLPLVLVALVIVGPMFGAALGAVDDHEIPMLQQQIAAEGPVGVWLGSLDPAQGRFRPGYWAGRLVETMAWGQNVRGWYLDRLLLLLATLGLGYLLARRWFAPGVSVIVAIAIVAGPQAEAFYRLGPQEAFAVPLTLAGFLLIRSWGLALLVLAAFVKEPFVVVPIVGMAWAWRLGLRWPVILAGVGTALAALGIVSAVIAYGGEFYTAQGRSIPLAGRYLYPFVIALALGLGWVLTRRPRLAYAAVPVLAVLLVFAHTRAQNWSNGTQAFVRQCAAGTVPMSDNPEVALAIQRWGCAQAAS